jgi:hypothetical protein
MVRWAPILILSSALSGAPFQCASEPDPNRALEETPGEALYELAVEFKKKGDDEAWRETLEYIIDRYPASRFAQTAKRDLAEGAPASSGSAKPGGKPARTAASPK